jgi:SAM-dependent methyltransferase
MSSSLEKITYRSLHRFPEITDDDRNLTSSNRTFGDYINNIDGNVSEKNSITQFIQNRFREIGKKIKVLDSGAGQGVALDTLLKSKWGKQIKKVTGVSIHSFANVKKVLTRHKNRIDWYLGDSLKVLPKLSAEYDLITDIWGSYNYSIDRVKLIKAIHGVLTIGGRAYIKTCGRSYIYVDGEREKLEPYIHKEYPETFKFEYDILIITKTSQRCPLGDYEAVESVFESSISPSSHSIRELKFGNAWYPKKIVFEREESSTSLRLLAGQPTQKKAKIQDEN